MRRPGGEAGCGSSRGRAGAASRLLASPPRPRRPRASGRSWRGRRRRASARAAGGARRGCPRRRARARRRRAASSPPSSRTGARLGRAGHGSPKRSSVRPTAASSRRVGRDRLDGRPADLRLERGRRALGHDPPVVDDPDAVGEDVGLLEVLRGEEDRDAVVAREPRDLVPERAAALRVEAGRGLVEEEDARRGGRARARGRAGASCRPSSVRTLRSAASVRPTRSSSSAAASAARPSACRGAPSAGACARGR